MRETRDHSAFRRAFLPVFASMLLSACRAASPVVTPTPLGPPPPAALALEGHLSPHEAHELAIIRWIHEGSGIVQRFRESGALADNVEWIVPGPSNILPFAGTWRGLDGIAEFARQLDATMRYDRVELQEYLVSANSVAAIFLGEGIAKATGRPFRSEILRLYTFDSSGKKIVRVRNFFDTGVYISAVRGGPP
ncbi:MAG: nuclear transport factor 2 family protein [Gemmatimonadota bacterium]|nr:nuclear transport factor 2 family protein [Gemmatimonadota bacterium]